jgi:hypothetical protein
MFIDRREGCDHMRGEMPDPGEKRHTKEVSREIEKLCKGTDKRLAQLKKKYASDVLVIRRLNEFEGIIEASADLLLNRHEFTRHSRAAGNTAFHIRPAISHC